MLQVRNKCFLKVGLFFRCLLAGHRGFICIIMAATRSKTSSDSKRGNFEEDDVQMPLKLVKELLKQQESTLKVFLSAYMDSVNTRIDNLM